jgi:hypothetical protein
MPIGSDGIVLELQRACLDDQVTASTILRKAKTIASKLDLLELKQWITSELDGYQCSPLELPDHRKGVGEPKFRNPYHGWCPIMTDNGRFAEIIRTVFLMQPIAELETLASGNASSSLIMNYNPMIQAELQKQMPVRVECALHFTKGQVASALDYIRNKTLDWTLELETRGILGRNLSFAREEQVTAMAVTNHIYGSNVGVLGSVAGDSHNSGVVSATHELSAEQLNELVSRIRQILPVLPEAIQTNLQAPLSELAKEAESLKPTPGRVSAALDSARKVLEGAGGNLAASGVLAALSAVSA